MHLILKPRASQEEIEEALAAHEALLPYQRLAQGSDVSGLLAADESQIDLVRCFADGHGLTVREISPERHRVVLRGVAAAVERAFGVTLEEVEIDGRRRHFHRGGPSLPSELGEAVEAVVGLDGLPFAGRGPSALAAPGAGFRGIAPAAVARWYDFPEDFSGRGQHIALIEFGGGYYRSDMQAYFKQNGLSVPEIRAHYCDNPPKPIGTPAPKGVLDRFIDMWNAPDASLPETMREMGDDDFLRAFNTLEVTMDIQLAGGLANGAAIDVYYADYTEAGYLAAIEQAVATKPAAISISWGSTECYWLQHGLTGIDRQLRLARASGVTVYCASGDSGSRGTHTEEEAGGVANVQFPASSPNVVACGATELYGDGGAGFSDERVWRDLTSHQVQAASGGGVSGYFAKPPTQRAVAVPSVAQIPGKVWLAPQWKGRPDYVGRGVPDVAASGAMELAYELVLGGRRTLGAGTSAAAPLWAALNARLAEGLGVSTGWMQPHIYRFGGQAPLVSIEQGSNQISDAIVGFEASRGWDPCTGWGRPNGAAWLQHLRIGDRRRVPRPRTAAQPGAQLR